MPLAKQRLAPGKVARKRRINRWTIPASLRGSQLPKFAGFYVHAGKTELGGKSRSVELAVLRTEADCNGEVAVCPNDDVVEVVEPKFQRSRPDVRDGTCLSLHVARRMKGSAVIRRGQVHEIR